MNLGIIGAGPAGIICAIEAKKRNHNVKLFDLNSNIGRKLSITGAGRGNLTNLQLDPSRYYCQYNTSPENLIEILSRYNSNFLVNYFEELGITTYHTDDGWVYPVSNSAKNLSVFLELILKDFQIEIFSNTEITSCSPYKDGFTLHSKENKNWKFHHVIIATGSKAYPQIGSSISLIDSLIKLGYKINPFLPALAPVRTTKNHTSFLKGQRFNSNLSLSMKHQKITEEFGNIIFTDWGINGPGVMNLSHFCNHLSSNLTLTINPLISNQHQLAKTIKNHPNRNLLFSTILLPLVPTVLIEQYQKNMNPYINKRLYELESINPDILIRSFDLEETVLGTRGFDYSQVSSGGVDINQVDLFSMKSKIHNNLSFCGEVLDIVGPCGGYNLHWAFVSGYIAGKNI